MYVHRYVPVPELPDRAESPGVASTRTDPRSCHPFENEGRNGFPFAPPVPYWEYSKTIFYHLRINGHLIREVVLPPVSHPSGSVRIHTPANGDNCTAKPDIFQYLSRYQDPDPFQNRVRFLAVRLKRKQGSALLALCTASLSMN